MAQEQAAEPKPSLLARVFGSRIAQALGILGIGWTLFQGLEPFLKFSRLMTYLAGHWREWTRGLWNWLASLVHLAPPEWTLDLITLTLFLLLFTIRGLRNRTGESILIRYRNRMISKLQRSPTVLRLVDKDSVVLGIVALTIFLLHILIVPIAIFLTIQFYIGVIWATAATIVLGIAYIVFLFLCLKVEVHERFYGIFLSSERAVIVLLGLLALNYLALHSHTIEAFIERATQ